MPDLVLLLTLLLSTWTASVFVLYYQRLRRLGEEYEKAKNVVEDIVISFNKELKTEKAQISSVAWETKTLSSQSKKVLDRVREFERSLKRVREKVKKIPEVERKVSVETSRLNKKLHDVVTTQKGMAEKIGQLEKTALQPSVKPESGIEAVIPLKREQALEPLTNTELRVLNVLATERRKTAPEIQNKIKLTREHTARLMKKLYEQGYLERDTKKIPYVYRLKQEMLKILKKTKA
ncbi:MAG: winged helix DNA-binding protein [Thermoproteota archaeon]|nr:winged helix DNA-binding protein [Thermoproteota archaeon]